MLKDNQPTYHLPENSISAEPNIETNKIWAFIDTNVVNFPSWYSTVRDVDREDRITDAIVQFFQVCKFKQFDGYAPYDFRPHPTQQYSNRKPDIGIYLLNNRKDTIIEIEAKIFSSKNSHNKEYVCGETGGIERFKRGLHSSHLPECGMFAYIFDAQINWLEKINNWIEKLSKTNTDTTICWSKNEILKPINTFKYHSCHQRKTLDDINLWHYFIEL